MDLREESNPHLRVWIGFDWLRRGTGGGLLWVRWLTFGFLRHGNSCVTCGLSIMFKLKVRLFRWFNCIFLSQNSRFWFLCVVILICSCL
jgi:hypothetical protein